MFKPVIEGTASGRAGILSRYVEQATMIHEFGHAVGLVNNGLAMAAPHQDQANGAHCTNDSCVMYYAVEGVGGVVDFVQQYVTTGSNVLFGEECLADAAAAR
jgi:hypothetical protein